MARESDSSKVEKKDSERDNEQSEARRLTLPRIFKSELPPMMYGFGDELAPRRDSVELLEEMMLQYVQALVGKTTEVAETCRRDKPDVSDVMFVIRKDRRKLERVRYLLKMKEEIAQVKGMDAEKMAANS